MTCETCGGSGTFISESFDVGDVRWHDTKETCWKCVIAKNPTRYCGVPIREYSYRDPEDREIKYAWVYLVCKKRLNAQFEYEVFISDRPNLSLFLFETKQEAAELFAQMSLAAATMPI